MKTRLMKYTLFIFTIIICISSCTKNYNIDYKTEPVLLTEPIDIISPGKLLFKAKTLGVEASDVIDYGFIFNTYGSPKTTIQVGTSKVEQNFETIYQGDIIDGKLYRVRSYITTAEKQILGTESFIGLNGRERPYVHDFNPKQSQLYNTIRIDGGDYEGYKNFGVYIDNKRVPTLMLGNVLHAKVQGVQIGQLVSVKVVIDLFQFELDEKLLIVK